MCDQGPFLYATRSLATIKASPQLAMHFGDQIAPVNCSTLGFTVMSVSGATAIDPVFILDQTFCPNVHFLGAGTIADAGRHRTAAFAGTRRHLLARLCLAPHTAAAAPAPLRYPPPCPRGSTPHSTPHLCSKRTPGGAHPRATTDVARTHHRRHPGDPPSLCPCEGAC